MKKHTLFFFLIGICFQAISQHQADKWYFGVTASVDFTSGTAVAGSGALNTAEGSASVCDASGSLLFYTDGVSVWDNTNTVMPSGTGLMGDISSTQSALIVPSPANTSLYYIFTTAADGGSNGFRYSEVDMTLNGGLGDVVAGSKNIPLLDSVTEKIAAFGNRSDGYWVVAHKWGNDAFYAYRLTSSGLDSAVISNAGIMYTTERIQNTYGQMKFNMCGNKLALAAGYLNTVEVFNFDQATGIVSAPLTIPMGDHVYGIEFSKSSQLLYVTCYDPTVTLAQFNISLSTLSLIMASKTPLTITSDLYGLQIAPDGKIYVAKSFNQYLAAVSSPDTVGSGCNYVENALNLDPSSMGIMSGLTLPSFLQSFLNDGVVCTDTTPPPPPPPPTGINENAAMLSSSVFPNPSGDEFFFLFNSNKQSQLIIYDYAGKKVEEYNLSATTTLHFGRSFVPGIYFAVYKNNDEVKTFKIVKE